ncbi:MAG: hypothetical protein HYY86_01525 [Candidatus Harrisonbacteria bacterium]|nr:hypothetical protein [Candidatus Harrisonbacteria bacterium]
MFAQAQTSPEFLVSWRALNYVPADYQGKIFPTKSTRVEAAFDLIDKNKAADLSRNEIAWYLNNNFLRSGVGLKSIAFDVPNNLDQNVRVAVSGYKENTLEKIFLLPAKNPEAVISAKTPAGKILRNRPRLSPGNYLLEARPFFFNISGLADLKFGWLINGKPVPGTPDNPEFLSLNLQSEGPVQETELGVSLGVSNLFNQLEIASRLINFVVK